MSRDTRADSIEVLSWTPKRFCTKCGERLIPKKVRVIGYDFYDGSKTVRCELVCPNRRVYNFGHMSIFFEYYTGERRVEGLSPESW